MNVEIATMFAMAVVSVGMWTLRVTVAASGRRLASALVAALEAVVFVLTFSHLVSDLSSPSRLASYAAGVAVGTAVGLLIHDRISRRDVEIQVVAPGAASPAADVVRELGWPATVGAAMGPDGPVTQLWLTVSSAELHEVTEAMRCAVPEAFVSTRTLTSTNNVQRRGRAGGSTPPARAGWRRQRSAPPFCSSRQASHSSSPVNE